MILMFADYLRVKKKRKKDGEKTMLKELIFWTN